MPYYDVKPNANTGSIGYDVFERKAFIDYFQIDGSDGIKIHTTWYEQTVLGNGGAYVGVADGWSLDYDFPTDVSTNICDQRRNAYVYFSRRAWDSRGSRQ